MDAPTPPRVTLGEIRTMSVNELLMYSSEAPEYRLKGQDLANAAWSELERRDRAREGRRMLQLTWAQAAMALASTVFVVLSATGVVGG